MHERGKSIPAFVYRVSCVGKVYLVIVLLSLHNHNGKHITLLLDCFWPERFLLPLAADAKSAISAAQDAACCEAAALHHHAYPSICLSSCLRVRFFCYRDFRFCQNDAATATVQREEKRRGEEQKGRAEKKSRQEEAQHLSSIVTITISNSPRSPVLASSYAASSWGKLEGWRSTAWQSKAAEMDTVLFGFRNHRGQALEARILSTCPGCVDAPPHEGG